MVDASTADETLPRGLARLRRVIRSHPFATVVIAALVVRSAVAVGIFMLAGGTLFDDDVAYLEVGRALSHGIQQAPGFVRQTGAFVFPLTGALLVGGGSTLAGQLLSAFAGSLVAGSAAALGRRATGSVGWGLVAGAVVAFLPSQVLWSSLVLKDPFVWLAVSVVAVGLAREPALGSSRSWVPVAAGTIALGFLRGQSAIVSGLALIVSLLLIGGRKAWPAVGVVLALVIAAPWAGGYGPAGWSVIESGTDAAAIRAKTAEGAATAVVEEAPDGTDPAGLGLEHLPRGVSVYLLEPYPWQPTSSDRLAPARWENLLVWYPVLALAAIGILAEVRRLRWTLFPALYGAGMTVAYALTEGNLGTAFRHRGEVVWVMALFAGVGGRLVFRRFRWPTDEH